MNEDTAVTLDFKRLSMNLVGCFSLIRVLGLIELGWKSLIEHNHANDDVSLSLLPLKAAGDRTSVHTAVFTVVPEVHEGW